MADRRASLRFHRPERFHRPVRGFKGGGEGRGGARRRGGRGHGGSWQTPFWHVGPNGASSPQRRPGAARTQTWPPGAFVSQTPVARLQVLHWLAPVHATPVHRFPHAPQLSHLPGELPLKVAQVVPSGLKVGAAQTPAPAQIPVTRQPPAAAGGHVVRSHAATQAPTALHSPLPVAVKSHTVSVALGVSQTPVARLQVLHWLASVHVAVAHLLMHAPAPLHAQSLATASVQVAPAAAFLGLDR